MRAQLDSKAIPPTYAPPRPPPEGKQLTIRQKAILAATILLIILVFVLAALFRQGRLLIAEASL